MGDLSNGTLWKMQVDLHNKMSTVKILQEMGYDGSDVHKLFTYFNIIPIIKDPNGDSDKELEDMHKRSNQMDKLVENRNTIAIDKAISYYDLGITIYTSHLMND